MTSEGVPALADGYYWIRTPEMIENPCIAQWRGQLLVGYRGGDSIG